MKRIKLFIIFMAVLALLVPTTAYAKDPFDDEVIFGGTYTVESGETKDGNIVVFGGVITTKEDSTVNGDIVLMGGSAEVNGTVNGSVVGIGGAVHIGANALINGDVFTLGASLNREEGARINGQVVNGTSIPFDFTVPGDIEIPDVPAAPAAPQVNVRVQNPILEMMWFFFRTFLWAALAVLLVIFFPTQANRVNQAAISQPLITGGAGLLTAILTPFVLVALTITIILIPVTLIAALLLAIAWLFGWVALGLEVGRRIAKLLNLEVAPAISAGVGTFILFFVLGGFSQLIACVGWIPQTLVGIWALGAVVMTRFGTQAYPVESTSSTSAALVEKIPQPEVIIEDDDEADELEPEGEATQDDSPEPVDPDLEPGDE